MPSYRVGVANPADPRAYGQDRPVHCLCCNHVIGTVDVIGPLSQLDVSFVESVWPALAESVHRHERECRYPFPRQPKFLCAT